MQSQSKVRRVFFNDKPVFILLFSLISAISFGQITGSIKTKPIPAADKKLDSLMQIVNAESYKENKLNYDINVLMSDQNRSFGLLNEQIQKGNAVLKEGIDYKGFTAELDILLKWKDESIKGIVKNTTKMQTVRDLTTTAVLLNELLKRTTTQLDKISANNRALSTIQRKIDSMAIDKIFYQVPIQNTAKKNYYLRRATTASDLSIANKNLKNAIDSIQKLEIKGKRFKYSLESDIAFLKNARRTLNEKTNGLKSDIEKSSQDYPSLVQNFKYSFVKGYLLFVFYFANQTGILTVLLFFIIGLALYLKVIRGKYIKAAIFDDLKYPGYVLNHPIAASLLIMISVFQFFLPTPPFVFDAFLWIISGVCLTLILNKSVSMYWFQIWIAFFILNNIAFQDNLFLMYSPKESYFILLMSILGLLLGFTVLKNRKVDGKAIKERSFVVALVVFMVLELVAAICILNGSYNLGKLLMTNGYFTMLIAYQLIWAFSLSIDVFHFSKYLITKEDDLTAETEPKVFKVSNFIYVLFVVSWYILISRNTYTFQSFMQPISDSFYKEQHFGEFTFSFNSIFVFFFILFMSGLSARIVSFLTTESRSSSESSKSGLGSWLLLIRIGIITFGVLIAFMSVGIPMDKIALMISALSVGIGFGLQNVINNLVSGVIIAFEKPINLDDIVEVGGNVGKMKSIGIRSSVVTTWDGADVIIPNGDLLSQHLVNWTNGSTKRRYEIDLGVAYGSDLNQVKTILIEVLNQHELILKNPTPMVWVTKFNDSSIDFVIKYWVPHFNFGNDVRNDLIIAIDVAFKTNGIEIPFPQQNVYLQSMVADSKDATGDKLFSNSADIEKSNDK
jgi:potassium efflux system protein